MMQNFSFTDKTMLLSLLLIFAASGGCALFQEPEDVEIKIPQENNNINYEVLVKESRAEADRLRSELATMRIAAAKQNGNFQFSENEKNNLRLRDLETELASEVQTLKANNLKLQEERDQLRHQNVQLQARSEALPGMRQLVMDIKALQTSVHQLVQKMETLSGEILQVKQDMAIQEHTLQTVPPKLTKLPKIEPPKAPHERTTITVEYGDTLWDIARTHDISVETLKTMNGLGSDSIFEGQQLEVPLSQSRPSERSPQAELAAKKGEQKSNGVTDHEEAPNAQEGP